MHHQQQHTTMTRTQREALEQEMQPTFDVHGNADVVIEAAFVVSDKDGRQSEKAKTGVHVISPTGTVLDSRFGVEDETIVAHARGGPGPWRLCFTNQRSKSTPLLVDISYFTVSLTNIPNAVFGFGTDADDEHSETVPEHVATDEFLQASDLHAIAVSAHRLKSVISHARLEQRHMKQQDHRRFMTATAARNKTLYYGILTNIGIIAASAHLVWRIRSMFTSEARDWSNKNRVAMGPAGLRI